MSSVTKISRFPELVQLQAPRGTHDALEELASRQHRTKTGVARQAILRELGANGVSLNPDPDRVLA